MTIGRVIMLPMGTELPKRKPPTFHSQVLNDPNKSVYFESTVNHETLACLAIFMSLTFIKGIQITRIRIPNFSLKTGSGFDLIFFLQNNSNVFYMRISYEFKQRRRRNENNIDESQFYQNPESGFSKQIIPDPFLLGWHEQVCGSDLQDVQCTGCRIL